MIYIIDAYNLIHKTPALESQLDVNLQAAREALIHYCRALANKRGDITQIILVFDGKSEFRGLPSGNSRDIKNVFTETGETADERIVKILGGLSDTKQKSVVSDDNFVRNHTRANAARVISTAQFQALAKKTFQKGRSTGGKSSGAKNIPKHLADEITDTYKKHLGLD